MGCCNCNYYRKHAIKLLLNQRVLVHSLSGLKRSKYSEAVSQKLAEFWAVMDNPYSTTPKGAISHWLPYDEDCDEEIKRKLLEIGSSIRERHLPSWKKKHVKNKSSTTPPKMKVQIPLEILKNDQRESIGYFEADTVAHCGNSLAERFAWSLTMTEICTGRTENRASFSKNAEGIKKIRDIESSLPFKIVGVIMDVNF